MRQSDRPQQVRPVEITRAEINTLRRGTGITAILIYQDRSVLMSEIPSTMMPEIIVAPASAFARVRARVFNSIRLSYPLPFPELGDWGAVRVLDAC